MMMISQLLVSEAQAHEHETQAIDDYMAEDYYGSEWGYEYYLVPIAVLVLGLWVVKKCLPRKKVK